MKRFILFSFFFYKYCNVSVLSFSLSGRVKLISFIHFIYSNKKSCVTKDRLCFEPLPEVSDFKKSWAELWLNATAAGSSVGQSLIRVSYFLFIESNRSHIVCSFGANVHLFSVMSLCWQTRCAEGIFRLNQQLFARILKETAPRVPPPHHHQPPSHRDGSETLLLNILSPWSCSDA